MFKTVNHVRLYESVTEQLMDLIKNKELKPGDKLPPERDLSKDLSVSRGSLREAFRVLESRGLIMSKPGGGRVIREIDKHAIFDTENIILDLEKSSILELLEARELFEPKIVELAARRASSEDLNAIEAVLDRAKKEDTNENAGEDYKWKTGLDTEFHLAMARASRNFVFVNIMKLHMDLLRETRLITWQVPGRKREQQLEHEAIFEAIKAHDSRKAGRAMLLHLKNIRKVITVI